MKDISLTEIKMQKEKKQDPLIQHFHLKPKE